MLKNTPFFTNSLKRGAGKNLSFKKVFPRIILLLINQISKSLIALIAGPLSYSRTSPRAKKSPD